VRPRKAAPDRASTPDRHPSADHYDCDDRGGKDDRLERDRLAVDQRCKRDDHKRLQQLNLADAGNAARCEPCIPGEERNGLREQSDEAGRQSGPAWNGKRH
jgi:hypothetical protein